MVPTVPVIEYSIHLRRVYVPDFTTFLYNNSSDYQYRYLFTCLTLAHLISLSIYWNPQRSVECQEKDKEKKDNKTKTEIIT